MKKLGFLVLILVALIPAMSFADLQVGAVAMYKGDATAVSVNGLGLNDFTFGADARLKFSILQGSLAVLYYPEDSAGPVVLPASLSVLTDIGLSLDILFFRFGAGIGPNFMFALSETDWTSEQPIPVGLNLKLSADVNLGKFSLGLVGYYALQSFSDLGKPNFFDRARPWVGISALFKLF